MKNPSTGRARRQSVIQEKKSSDLLKQIQEKKNGYWNKVREEQSLVLFHNAASKIPAYKDFLRKNKIDPGKVKTYKDFEKLPIISKDNYLRVYPLKDLVWNGSLNEPQVFTSTSGSTGEPFYFSRNHGIDWQSSVIHELFFTEGSFDPKVPTLVVVCFGMGVWIGGVITYQAFEMLANRNGYPISILTPGINKEEIFKALKKLAPSFPQIILAGYPPFVKDVIDEAPRRGIELKKHKVKLLFAAEAFTEKFRDHVSKNAGVKQPLFDTMNIYGSADIGTMAFETPLSIMIRRIAMKKPKLFKSLFGHISKTPTFAQYIPSFINFEGPKHEILLTGDNSIPLIRYSIGDFGGVYTFNQVFEKLATHGVSLYKEVKKAKIDHHLYQLPFVYVYERMDFSTTLYGLQIYPETIKEVLLEKPFNRLLTGKITLTTIFNKNQDQYLEVNLELQRGREISKVMKNQLSKQIIKNLRAKNSEFRELSDYLKHRADPKLIFWPCEDPQYFKVGIKQRWVKK